jgi:hypothetical protein
LNGTTLRPLERAVALAAAAGGIFVAWQYYRRGLTLTHYDARGHLVVARRIADSITPGWQQIGAVWLPLPHVLNALPVQVNLSYRTGASAVAMSILAFAVATGSAAAMVRKLTNSSAAAVAAAAVFALNPNVLYLQSTPMTEPLLMALTALGVARLIEWCQTNPRSSGASVGWTFALACMTRYEAWPITAAALVAAAWTLWRRGMPRPLVRQAVGRISAYPAVALLAFIVFSRVVVGEWFVGSSFFVPENKALGDLWLAGKEIGWGTRELSGPLLIWIAAIGLIGLTVVGLASRSRVYAIAAVSLVAAAVIPWVAFYKGHPFRIRYMVPLILAEAVAAGFAAGMFRRAQPIAASLVIVVALFELRPLDPRAPMVVEAQWDRPNRPARAKVTACLTPPSSPEKIMASMGSLGHYMQETSAQGYGIRNFLHEGNGDIWLAALNNPRPYAGWILIEEIAEGGDMLARLARERPTFLSGYTRACEGAGMALYRRRELTEK